MIQPNTLDSQAKGEEDEGIGDKKMDTLQEDVMAEDLDSEEDGGDDEIVLFVEYKHCTICHLE